MKTQMIPQSQVVFGSASLTDDVGRLFFWNDGVYRAINPKYVNFYRELLDKNVLDDLFDKRLIRTSVASQSLEGYELTLQHQRVPFVSCCAEWTAEMLRDAALFYCDLVADLDARGLGLKDAHPWNVLFDRGYPIFVDFGSIVGDHTCSAGVYKEFQHWFIMPLLLMSTGLSRLAHTLLINPDPPSLRDILSLLISRVYPNVWLQYWFNLRRLQRTVTKDGTKVFALARAFINSIPIISATTEWSNYQGPGSVYSIDKPDEWPAKSKNIQFFLEKFKPSTVIDIGCNRGWYSDLAVSTGAEVVAVDIDEPNINALYQRVRVSQTSLLPLLMDVCIPTPAHGYSFPAASTRLKSDLVLALAITHHLVFKRGLSFEFISERLATFSSKWLIVEFVPSEDQYVSEWMSDKFNWYCLNNFRKALERFFQRIDIVDSYPSPRVLLICEK